MKIIRLSTITLFRYVVPKLEGLKEGRHPIYGTGLKRTSVKTELDESLEPPKKKKKKRKSGVDDDSHELSTVVKEEETEKVSEVKKKKKKKDKKEIE